MIGKLLVLVIVSHSSQAQADPAQTLNTATARNISLKEAYVLTLKHSEELAVTQEAITQAKAHIHAIISSMQPQIFLKGSEMLQDQAPDSETGLANTFNRRTRPEAKVTLHQALFSGFQEFLTLKAAKAKQEAAELDLERAKHILYQDVAQAYFKVLSLQKENQTRLKMLDIHRKRIQELKTREAVGRSRKSEVLAGESQLAQLEAELESSRGQERMAQDILQFLTNLHEIIIAQETPLPALEPLEILLKHAQKRPDVEAKQRDLAAAEFSLKIAQRGRLPALGLDGNYYLKRVGFQEDIRWDILLTAQLPLFTGGGISVLAEQAQSKKRASQEVLSLIRRRAQMEVLSAYRNMESTLLVIRALQKALQLAENNYEAQSKDYRLGLVTNIEVLESFNTLQETQLKLDDALLSSSLAHVRLEAASGVLKI